MCTEANVVMVNSFFKGQLSKISQMPVQSMVMHMSVPDKGMTLFSVKLNGLRVSIYLAPWQNNAFLDTIRRIKRQLNIEDKETRRHV